MTISYSSIGANVLHGDVRLTMTAQQLNGSQRVLLDGVISEDECKELQQLSNVSSEKRLNKKSGFTQEIENGIRFEWLYKNANAKASNN